MSQPDPAILPPPSSSPRTAHPTVQAMDSYQTLSTSSKRALPRVLCLPCPQPTSTVAPSLGLLSTPLQTWYLTARRCELSVCTYTFNVLTFFKYGRCAHHPCQHFESNQCSWPNVGAAYLSAAEALKKVASGGHQDGIPKIFQDALDALHQAILSMCVR
jgi:hypothetical protein